MLVLLKLGFQQRTGPRQNFELAESSGCKVLSQDRVQQRVVEHVTEAHVPAPLMTEQLVDVPKIVLGPECFREQCVPFRE